MCALARVYMLCVLQHPSHGGAESIRLRVLLLACPHTFHFRGIQRRGVPNARSRLEVVLCTATDLRVLFYEANRQHLSYQTTILSIFTFRSVGTHLVLPGGGTGTGTVEREPSAAKRNSAVLPEAG